MALTYLLDTNTVSYLLRNQPPAVRKHMDQAALPATCISTITEAELCYGLASKAGAIRQRIAIDAFLSSITIMAWDSRAARAYGLLRAKQDRKGRPLSAEDLMIAAHALSLGLVLVTSDRAFSYAEGLRTEDWAVE